jgi:sRNA-binding protein
VPTTKQLDEVIALLVARFPNTFVMFKRRRKPLKIGIHQDLAAALGEFEHLSAALEYYTRNIGYLKAQKAGAKRVRQRARAGKRASASRVSRGSDGPRRSRSTTGETSDLQPYGRYQASIHA